MPSLSIFAGRHPVARSRSPGIVGRVMMAERAKGAGALNSVGEVTTSAAGGWYPTLPKQRPPLPDHAA